MHGLSDFQFKVLSYFQVETMNPRQEGTVSFDIFSGMFF